MHEPSFFYSGAMANELSCMITGMRYHLSISFRALSMRISQSSTQSWRSAKRSVFVFQLQGIVNRYSIALLRVFGNGRYYRVVPSLFDEPVIAVVGIADVGTCPIGGLDHISVAWPVAV